MAALDKIKVKQVRSSISCTKIQKANLRGLGLAGPGRVRVVEDTPANRGMIKKIIHLIEVSRFDAAEKAVSEKRVDYTLGAPTSGTKTKKASATATKKKSTKSSVAKKVTKKEEETE